MYCVPHSKLRFLAFLTLVFVMTGCATIDNSDYRYWRLKYYCDKVRFVADVKSHINPFDDALFVFEFERIEGSQRYVPDKLLGKTRELEDGSLNFVRFLLGHNEQENYDGLNSVLLMLDEFPDHEGDEISGEVRAAYNEPFLSGIQDAYTMSKQCGMYSFTKRQVAGQKKGLLDD